MLLDILGGKSGGSYKKLTDQGFKIGQWTPDPKKLGEAKLDGTESDAVLVEKAATLLRWDVYSMGAFSGGPMAGCKRENNTHAQELIDVCVKRGLISGPSDTSPSAQDGGTPKSESLLFNGELEVRAAQLAKNAAWEGCARHRIKTAPGASQGPVTGASMAAEGDRKKGGALGA